MKFDCKGHCYGETEKSYGKKSVEAGGPGFIMNQKPQPRRLTSPERAELDGGRQNDEARHRHDKKGEGGSALTVRKSRAAESSKSSHPCKVNPEDCPPNEQRASYPTMLTSPESEASRAATIREQIAFRRRRQAGHSRRSYYKTKRKFEELQSISITLQNANKNLLEKNCNLESLLARSVFVVNQIDENRANRDAQPTQAASPERKIEGSFPSALLNNALRISQSQGDTKSATEHLLQTVSDIASNLPLLSSSAKTAVENQNVCAHSGVPVVQDTSVVIRYLEAALCHQREPPPSIAANTARGQPLRVKAADQPLAAALILQQNNDTYRQILESSPHAPRLIESSVKRSVASSLRTSGFRTTGPPQASVIETLQVPPPSSHGSQQYQINGIPSQISFTQLDNSTTNSRPVMSTAEPGNGQTEDEQWGALFRRLTEDIVNTKSVPQSVIIQLLESLLSTLVGNSVVPSMGHSHDSTNNALNQSSPRFLKASDRLRRPRLSNADLFHYLFCLNLALKRVNPNDSGG